MSEELSSYRLGVGTVVSPLATREIDRADNNKPHSRVLGGNYVTITAVYPLLEKGQWQALLYNVQTNHSMFEWRDTFTGQLYSVMHGGNAPVSTPIAGTGGGYLSCTITLEGEPIDG